MQRPTGAKLRHRRGSHSRSSGIFAAVAAAVASVSGSGAADRPVAIIEDVTGTNAVRVMDYLAEGRVLSLKPGDELVIGYLTSCVVETIAGGTVTIGLEQSSVAQGAVSRRRVACDAERLHMTGSNAELGGAMIYRDAGRPKARIYGLSPALSVSSAGILRLQRLDQPSTPIELEVTAGSADLASNGVLLVPNGVYRATLGDRMVVFNVDATATEDAPLIARLLRL